MKNIKDIVFVVGARLASERTPRKMIKAFAGSCLLEICLRKLKDCPSIPNGQIYLSAYEDEIKEIGRRNDIAIFERSYESTLEPVTLQVVYDWAFKLDFDYYFVINACNPLLKVDTIERALEAFINSNARGLFGVIEKKNFFFNKEGHMVSIFKGEDKYLATLDTKQVEPLLESANSIYCGMLKDIQNGIYMGSFKTPDDPQLFIISEDEVCDIDWPWQFELAEIVYRRRYLESR